uniref:GPX4 peroxidase n=1 Tax=Scophthalmus maximus TaxID=52904 RepID=A0A8D2ZR25_SCOMX
NRLARICRNFKILRQKDKRTCAQVGDWQSAKSIYEFSAKDIDGNEVSLEKYRGSVCIIVNVASK